MNIPDSIESLLLDIEDAKSRSAVLRLFSKLIDEVRLNKRLEKGLKQLHLQLKARTEGLQEAERIVLEWMAEKIAVLDRMQYSAFPFVEKLICRARELVIERRYQYATEGINFSQWFLGLAYSAFVNAIEAIVRYQGNHQAFEGWVKIGRMKHSVSVDLLPRFPEGKEGIVPMNAEQQKLVAERLGHGVAYWEIISPRQYHATGCDGRPCFIQGKPVLLQSERQILALSGSLAEILPPPNIQEAIKKCSIIHIKKWEENRDCDDVTLYEWMIFLAQYSSINPVVFPLKNEPKTWEEHDESVAQANNAFFLSEFSPDANSPLDDWPFPIDDLKGLARRFLRVLMRHSEEYSFSKKSSSQASKRKVKQHPDRDKVQEYARKKWQKDNNGCYVGRKKMLRTVKKEINNNKLHLNRPYGDDAIYDWLESVDPTPKEERKKRPKS